MKSYKFKNKKGWMCRKTSIEVGDKIKYGGGKWGFVTAINENKVSLKLIDLKHSAPDNLIYFEDEGTLKENQSFGNEVWFQSSVMKSVLNIEEYIDIHGKAAYVTIK